MEAPITHPAIDAATTTRRQTPPLYVGPATPERCAEAAEAVAAAKRIKATLKSVAADLGCTRGMLHKMVQAHGAMRSYAVTLWREGSREMPVCTVITPKGAQAAAVAAFREFPGTLKNLELPGWKLSVGDAVFDLLMIAGEASTRGRLA